MRIDAHKSRTAGLPLHGVKFTAQELTKINELARTFANVPSDTLFLIREALAHSALRLEAVSDWTCGPSEDNRRTQHEETLITYRAVYLAFHRAD